MSHQNGNPPQQNTQQRTLPNRYKCLNHTDTSRVYSTFCRGNSASGEHLNVIVLQHLTPVVFEPSTFQTRYSKGLCAGPDLIRKKNDNKNTDNNSHSAANLNSHSVVREFV